MRVKWWKDVQGEYTVLVEKTQPDEGETVLKKHVSPDDLKSTIKESVDLVAPTPVAP